MANDPFEGGLRAYGERLRDGTQTITGTLKQCLERIERYDDHLQAFQLLDAERALDTANALDALLASGTDLGPLMGVPMGVKDIIGVDGLPTTNGSLHDAGQPGPHSGTVVRKLKQAGCIVVGKTRTVEFALGATGLNSSRGTPTNPWDWETRRIPGGSSSGSGVSVAAGFVGFALGSDTGGSIRIPACFNGIFGHKTTLGLWPTDGVFPLSPSLDSLGPLCRSASDAALIHEVLFGGPALIASADSATPGDNALAGTRFGIPQELFFDNLDSIVSETFELAIEKLKAAGATIETVSLPESHERATLFPKIVPPELLHALGRDKFKHAAAQMDPVTRERAEAGLAVDAIDYHASLSRMDELTVIGAKALENHTALLAPTCPFVPLAIASLEEPAEHERSLLASQNTQPANLMRLCATSLPVQHLNKDASLPIGLQVMAANNQDAALLRLSHTIESVLGRGPLPVLPDR